MRRDRTGEYVSVSTVGGEPCRAFVPAPLPPVPALVLDGELHDLHDRALLALGRFDSVTTLLPDTSLFLYMYVRKEAVLSSQIEGTQSSLADLLLFESNGTPGVPLDEVREVSNYVAAVQHGQNRLREGFPLSLRLLKEIHQILLSKGRGSEKEPGEFRRSQNWVGGSRPANAVFVPPPPERIMECLGAWEKFLHNDPVQTPSLVKAALAHVQFESIHPFLDGNGRVGRLLIALLLCAEKVLAEPVLYLSLYFKANRQRYYDLLQLVRIEGDWEEWLRFFLVGVREVSEEAVQTAQRLSTLFKEDERKIETLGRAAGSALRVHRALQRSPLVSVARLAKDVGLSLPTVRAALSGLERQGIVREVTGRLRGRIFGYDRYMKILGEGA